MRQQINLYQEGLIDRVQPLSSRHAALILLLVLATLAVLGGYGFRQQQKLEQQRHTLGLQLETLRGRSAVLELQYPQRTPSPLLQQQVTQREQEVRELAQALDTVMQQEQGRNADLLASLEGLARHPHSGVWLRQVRLGKQGRDVELSGRALKPEMIPDYLQWLTDGRIFSGLTFSRLQLSRLQEEPGHVDFTLGTGSAGAR